MFNYELINIPLKNIVTQIELKYILMQLNACSDVSTSKLTKINFIILHIFK